MPRRGKIEKMLDKILDDNEEPPTDTDKRWKRVANSDSYVITVPKTGKSSKKFKITKKLIDQMKEYNKLYHRATNYKYPIELEEIAKIYAVVDPKTNNFYVGYTTTTVCYSIKMNLSRYYRDTQQSQSIFFSFLDPKRLEVITLEYVKNFTLKDLRARKKHYEEEFNKKEIKDYDVNDCFEKFMDHYEETIEPFKNTLKQFEGTIYGIVDKNSNKKFIGYVATVLKEDQYTDIVDIFYDTYAKKKVNKEDLELNILSKEKVHTDLHLELLTDSYIMKEDTIQNGFNTDYLMFDDDPTVCSDNIKFLSVRKIMFGKIQMEIFMRTYEDNTDYDKTLGFIYMITNKVDGKKYISYVNYDEKDNKSKKKQKGKPTLKDIVGAMYEKAIDEEMKDQKTINPLGKDLLSYSFDSFDVQILMKRTLRSRFNIKLKTADLIKKHHSDIDGYNRGLSLRQKVIIGKKGTKTT